MACEAVQAGVCRGRSLCAAPEAPDTKPPGHSYRSTANHPPVAGVEATQLPAQEKKNDQAAHYVSPIWVREQMQM